MRVCGNHDFALNMQKSTVTVASTEKDCSLILLYCHVNNTLLYTSDLLGHTCYFNFPKLPLPTLIMLSVERSLVDHNTTSTWRPTAAFVSLKRVAMRSIALLSGQQRSNLVLPG